MIRHCSLNLRRMAVLVVFLDLRKILTTPWALILCSKNKRYQLFHSEEFQGAHPFYHKIKSLQPYRWLASIGTCKTPLLDTRIHQNLLLFLISSSDSRQGEPVTNRSCWIKATKPFWASQMTLFFALHWSRYFPIVWQNVWTMVSMLATYINPSTINISSHIR